MFKRFGQKWIIALSVTLIGAIALAACSSSDDTVTTSSSSGTVQQPDAPAAAAAATGDSSSPSAPVAADAPAQPSGGTSPVMVVEPKVDRVVIAFPAPSSEGNDSNFDFSSPPSVQLRPMYEYLVGVNSVNGGFDPQLATEWNIEPDGLGIRYQLRQGVQFQGGWGEFTAKDVEHVLWSISRADSLHGLRGTFARDVSEIQIINDYEVVFRLNGANPTVFNGISQLIGGMEIQSKAMYDAVGQPTLADVPIAGTGAYQFKERSQGSFVRFERGSGSHWRHSPDFPELELRWSSEASTRLAALLAGEVHLTTIIPDQEAQAKGQGMKLAKGNVPGFRTFFNFQGSWWNTHGDETSGRKFPDSPLLDQKVRQALSKAIDRDALNTAFFKGEADAMVNNHFHVTRPGWDASWETRFDDQYGYDPAAAKALLAEAGYNSSNPLETNIHSINLSTYAGSLDMIEAVQGFYREIGVEAKLVVMDGASRNAQARAHEFDNHISLVSTASDIFLAGRVYMSSSHPTSGNHQEPAINVLRLEAASTLVASVQAAALKQMGELAFSMNASIPLYWLPIQIAYSPDVVSDYVFAGNISGSWTHLYNIKAAQ